MCCGLIRLGVELGLLRIAQNMATTVQVPFGEGTFFSADETTFRSSRSADELCDDLLEHMLDCDLCLNSGEDTCCVHQQFRAGIARRGGASKGVVFAF